MTDTNPNTDLSALYHVAAWLQHRAARIGMERRRLEDSKGSHHLSWDHRLLGAQPRVAEDETKRRLAEAQDAERTVLQALERCWEAHRQSGQSALGIDALSEESRLSDDERTILLAAALVAINDDLGKHVLENLGGGMLSRLDVQAAIRLTDPGDIGGWVRARRYFRRQSPLVRDGLVTVEFPSPQCPPGDLLSASVEITAKAFATIVGDQSLMDEGQDTDNPDIRR